MTKPAPASVVDRGRLLEMLLENLLQGLKEEILASIESTQPKKREKSDETLFWTARETAAFISSDYSEDRVYEHIRAGDFAAIRKDPDRPKSPWLIDPDSVRQWKRRIIKLDAPALTDVPVSNATQVALPGD
jgi:hypothetical protein